MAYKWAAESREDGDWEMFSETGLLFFPYWRRSEIRYLQNNPLPSDRR